MLEFIREVTMLDKFRCDYIVHFFGAVMIPRIGRYFSEGKKEEARELLYESFRFIWFLGLPLCFGLIGISSNFVPWFFGTDYMKVIPLLWILAFLIPIIGISNVIGIQYLITTTRENLLTRSVCFGAIINFLLNLIMIPIFYSIGAAITSVIAEMCISAIQLFYIRKEFSFKRILIISCISYPPFYTLWQQFSHKTRKGC